MLPSQLQYKDVITRILPGFLFCIVVSFLLLLFYPLSPAELNSWLVIGIKEFLFILVPVTLAVSYALGAALGTIHFMLIQIAYQYPSEKRVDGARLVYIITRWLFSKFFRLSCYSSRKDPRFVPLLENHSFYVQLRERISKIHGYNVEEIINKFRDKPNNSLLTQVYDSCTNYNRTVSSSSAVAEIYRYSIFMEFNAQLAIIFSFCFFGSLSALFNCWFKFVDMNWFVKPPGFWLILTCIFYYFTRRCANKSVRNWRERCDMIYNTFYHLSDPNRKLDAQKGDNNELEN